MVVPIVGKWYSFLLRIFFSAYIIKPLIAAIGIALKRRTRPTPTDIIAHRAAITTKKSGFILGFYST